MANDEELLSDLIEKFCTLSVEEQGRIEDSGDGSIECYNGLFDHLSVRRRVPLMGENLYDSHDRETDIVVTQELVERLGPVLYERYLNCAQGQHCFDSSHGAVTSLKE